MWKTPSSLNRCCLKLSLWASRPRLEEYVVALAYRSSLVEQQLAASTAPFRKQLKDEERARRAEIVAVDRTTTRNNRSGSWELTVGIEVHAQLNTERKLFSNALTDTEGEPNSNITPFDITIPGAQPIFQTATLLPALRAALALNCKIEDHSQFDRKHYFYHDQPAGYQITQYYKPFATGGSIDLFDHDGIASEDGQCIQIGIKQVQIEQDTAKTNQQSATSSLVDFNRVGHPLIEIITLPQIHHPKTAAACVRKIQRLLQTVNANHAGIEAGGLRADINVSVRRRDLTRYGGDTDMCSGIRSLGQRTEMKNLVSFQAIEDAIVSERDRQIRLLEAGERIIGETRGWTIGSTETTSLRSKEGEVDYRYMPDPDISPILISQDIVTYLRNHLPQLPDETLADLTTNHGLSTTDAKALMNLDNGLRLQYFDAVYSLLSPKSNPNTTNHQPSPSTSDPKSLSKLAANYTLHELGNLLTSTNRLFSSDLVPPQIMANILISILDNHITPSTAKQLLRIIFNGDTRSVNQIIEEEDMVFKPLSEADYHHLIRDIMSQEPASVEKAKKDWAVGKQSTFMWFVGQVMKKGGKSAEADKAKAVLRDCLGVE